MVNLDEIFYVMKVVEKILVGVFIIDRILQTFISTQFGIFRLPVPELLAVFWKIHISAGVPRQI
jgi:hypothetical protein